MHISYQTSSRNLRMIFSLNPALFSVFHIFPITQDKNPQCIFDSFLWVPISNLKAIPSKHMWKNKTKQKKLGFSPAPSLSLAQQPEENSAQFSGSVMSNSLWPHGLQHARPPCPLPAPGVHSDSRPSSRWCHSTILFSVIPFSSHLRSSPASGSFQMSQFFASHAQSIGVSASPSVLPMNLLSHFSHVRLCVTP